MEWIFFGEFSNFCNFVQVSMRGIVEHRESADSNNSLLNTHKQMQACYNFLPYHGTSRLRRDPHDVHTNYTASVFIIMIFDDDEVEANNDVGKDERLVVQNQWDFFPLYTHERYTATFSPPIHLYHQTHCDGSDVTR